MQEFEIEIEYRREKISFPVRFAIMGYVYKFYIHIGGQEVTFELDDNGEFRAMTDSDAKSLNKELLVLIVEKLEQIRK